MTTITTRSLPLIPLTIPLNQLSSKSMSPQSMHSHARTKRSHSCDNMDEMSESRSSPVSSIQNSENYPKEIDDDEDADNEIDRISCCSDDSELSVGKEDDLEPTNKISENSLLSERRSSMDTIVTEDISNDSISLINRSLPANSSLSDNLIRFPIVRPSPTRFQEEFLRSSQLYAEELMKQQMSIVAAARGLPLTTSSTSTPAITQKFGFRPHLKSPSSTTNLLPQHLEHESLNFRGIHSHLNAISQITQNLSNISKITATSIDSRENSQSPPTGNSSSGLHLNSAHHHHHHLNHHQLNQNQLNQLNNLHNNNLNDSNLKFSIDNILKADFGRRITEPLKRTSKSSSLAHKRNHKKNNNNSSSSNNKNNNNNEINSGSSSNSNNNILAPIDLTAAQEKLSDNLNRVSTGSVNSINSGNNNNNNNSVEDIPSSTSSTSSSTTNNNSDGPMVWPAWVYCTRYSDRPSSGPRTRRPKKPPGEKITADEKRPRTAFSGPQLARLKHEFNENRYLTERRRQQLSSELGLNEAQIKIWFQNKRAKIKKSSGQKNPLALQLMAQGLYNHSTVPLTREEEELQQLQEQAGNV